MNFNIFKFFPRHPPQEVAHNLRNAEQFRRFLPSFMQHWLGLAIIVVFALLYGLGVGTPANPNISAPLSGLIVGLSLLAFVYLTPWLAAPFIRMCMVRNIPFLWGYIVFLTFFAILDLSSLVVMGIEGHTLGALPYRLLGRFVLIASVISFCVMYLEASIREQLGIIPELVPVFWPVAPHSVPIVSAQLLAPSAKGTLLSMQAANQYTSVISTEGEELLRGTLKEMIDRLPDDAGVRIHRSWWVAKSQLIDASVDDAKSVLITATGDRFPIGKSKRNAVISALNAQK